LTDIIKPILAHEGRKTNDRNDAGGRTDFGISERSNPDAWKDGKVTEEEAREIYAAKYIHAPRFHLVPYPLLRAELIDFGVHSGPHLAIQKIQEILNVEVDGVIGPQTLAAILMREERELVNLLMKSRIKMFGRLVQKRPTDLKFLSGWLNRALEYLIP
jgi:lysozyme family protein